MNPKDMPEILSLAAANALLEVRNLLLEGRVAFLEARVALLEDRDCGSKLCALLAQLVDTIIFFRHDHPPVVGPPRSVNESDSLQIR